MQDRQDVYKDDNKLDFFMASASVDAGTHRHTNLVKACRRRSAFLAKAAGAGLDKRTYTAMASTWTRAAAVVSIRPDINARNAEGILRGYRGIGDHVVDRVTRYLNILAANPNDQATADAVFTEGKAELEALIAEEEARGRRDGPWAFM